MLESVSCGTVMPLISKVLHMISRNRPVLKASSMGAFNMTWALGRRYR